jgi:hypothetical protein
MWLYSHGYTAYVTAIATAVYRTSLGHCLDGCCVHFETVLLYTMLQTAPMPTCRYTHTHLHVPACVPRTVLQTSWAVSCWGPGLMPRVV